MCQVFSKLKQVALCVCVHACARLLVCAYACAITLTILRCFNVYTRSAVLITILC